MRAMLVATAFLTRIPVPIQVTTVDVREATRWFPIVGAALGGVAAAISLVLMRGDSPPLLSATLLVSLGAWITGAIHLDGLADAADGFGGGRTSDDVLRIMRDPRVGSFGVVAVTLVMTLKIAALTALFDREIAIGALIAAPTLSRWAAVALGTWLPYARATGGLGEVAAQGGRLMPLLIATIITVAVTVSATGRNALGLWISTAAVIVVAGRSAQRRIGGVTGDVFGAVVELSETAVLITAVFVIS